MGRTSNNLLTRTNKHLLKSLLNKIRMGIHNKEKRKTKDTLYSNSGIGEHLIENQNYFEIYDVNRFKIVSKARNYFHLETLEAVYILSKNAELCKQNKLVYSTILFSSLNL